MRPLTEKQARSCENAKKKRCRCRCGGALHGAGRLLATAPRWKFELLPELDPRRLGSAAGKGRGKGEMVGEPAWRSLLQPNFLRRCGGNA